jgi:hypothetical protein
MIVLAKCDHLPEQAFYMVGGIEEVFEKRRKARARPLIPSECERAKREIE